MEAIDLMAKTASLIEKQEITKEEKADVLVDIAKINAVIKSKDKEIMNWQQRFNRQQGILDSIVAEKAELQIEYDTLKNKYEPPEPVEP